MRWQTAEIDPTAEEDGQHWLFQLAARPPETGRWQIDGRKLSDVEVLPDDEGLQFCTEEGARYIVQEGLKLSEPSLPRNKLLLGNNNVEYAWKATSKKRERGVWVTLQLPKQIDSNMTIDPRVAFCDAEPQEVWTARERQHAKRIPVLGVDRRGLRLRLESLPGDEASSLFLPIDLNALYLRQRALRQLRKEPLPHHAGLLRLCENPKKVVWPPRREPLDPLTNGMSSQTQS